MRRRAFVMLGAVAGCTSFESAAPNDAGVTDTTVTPVDAGGDAPTRAPPPVPRAASASCGWAPFDDDFERELPQGTWTMDHQGGVGGITLSTSDLESTKGTKSLLVDVAPANDDRIRYLTLILPTSTATCIDVHAYILAESVLGATRPLELKISKTKLLYLRLDVLDAKTASLDLREQDYAITDGGLTTSDIAAGSVTIGKWVDIGIHFDRATTPPTATLFIDGVARQPVNQLTFITAADVPSEVQVGCAYATTGSARYFLDEIAVR